MRSVACCTWLFVFFDISTVFAGALLCKLVSNALNKLQSCSISIITMKTSCKWNSLQCKHCFCTGSYSPEACKVMMAPQLLFIEQLISLVLLRKHLLYSQWLWDLPTATRLRVHTPFKHINLLTSVQHHLWADTIHAFCVLFDYQVYCHLPVPCP